LPVFQRARASSTPAADALGDPTLQVMLADVAAQSRRYEALYPHDHEDRTAAPDGTLYISALQHIYSSTNSGATWTELLGPIYASSINLNSDSSISVDPGNRLYFTFDYPYAGTTAVCTSDDRGITWACNPAVVPGGTDRMWTLAPTLSDDYEVTNEGLYETTFLHSTDRGSTWTPTALGAGLLEPQTGPLLQKPGSSNVLQITKVYGTLPQEVPELKLYVYAPNSAGSIIAAVRSTGLPLPLASAGCCCSGSGERPDPQVNGRILCRACLNRTLSQPGPIPSLAGSGSRGRGADRLTRPPVSLGYPLPVYNIFRMIPGSGCLSASIPIFARLL